MGNQPSNGSEGGSGGGDRTGHPHHGQGHPSPGPGYQSKPQGGGPPGSGSGTTSGGPIGQQQANQFNSYGHGGPPSSSTRSHASTMQKSPSDASMGEDNKSPNMNDSSTLNMNMNMTITDPNIMAQLSAADDDVVPTVFRWEHGGRDVYITGTFNEWTRQIPMHRSGNDFTYIHNLKRGKHAFKFIVDDEWRFAPDQPTVADIDGRINNFIDVTDFKPYTGDKSFEQEKNAAYYAKVHGHGEGTGHPHTHPAAAPGHIHTALNNEDDSMTPDGHHGHPQTFHPMEDPDGEVFTHNMPDLDEYTKDPPPLPPHLRHIILNKPPQLQDTAALPVPQHVALNHLYCTAIRDNMMVLGITQRFKTKFVTTVYYSPELSRT